MTTQVQMGQTPQERRRAEFFPPISLFLPFVLGKSAEGRNDASADSAYPNRKRTLHAQCPPASRRIGCSNIFGDRSFKVQRVVLPSKRKHAHQREPYLHKRVRPVFLRVAQQVRVRAAGSPHRNPNICHRAPNSSFPAASSNH